MLHRAAFTILLASELKSPRVLNASGDLHSGKCSLNNMALGDNNSAVCGYNRKLGGVEGILGKVV